MIIIVVILDAGYKTKAKSGTNRSRKKRRQFSKISFEGIGRIFSEKRKETERNGKEDSSRRRPFSETIVPRNSGTTEDTEKEESFEGNRRIIFEARQFLKISFEGKSDESLQGRKRRSFSENRSRNRTGQPTEVIEDRSRKRKYGARKKKIVLEDIVRRKRTDYFWGKTG